MKEDYQREIEEIIDGMKCPKDFKCYKSGLGKLCKAETFTIEGLLRCLEENPRECKFSAFYGDVYFCECPLRSYIAKKLEK